MNREPPLDSAEVDAIIAATSPTSSTGLRNRALILVLHRVAFRLGETLALACADVDLAAGTLRAARSTRIVPLDERAAAALGAWLARRAVLGIGADAPLFCALNGRALDPSYLRQLLPRLARRAGVTKRVSAEALRRAHAADLAAHHPTEVVQARLGHSRRSATQRYLRRTVQPSPPPQRVAEPSGAGPGGATTPLQPTLDGALVERRPVTGSPGDWRERYRALVETAAAGIIVIDGHGLIESVNPATERLFGYRADELVGANVSLLMPEPYHSEHDAYLERYLAGGEARVIGRGREVLGRTKDGTSFPLHLAVGEMEVGGRRMFTGIVSDLTERKRVEEDLRRIEKATRSAVEQAGGLPDEVESDPVRVLQYLGASLRKSRER